jgi:hypothetical protein
MFGQAHAREFNVVLSFETQLPFDVLPEWKEFRALPLAEQKGALADTAMRDKLVGAARSGKWPAAVGAEAREPDYEWIRVMDGPMPPFRSVADLAAQRGVHPAECMVDIALDSDFEQFFLQQILNADPSAVLEIMRQPRCIPTFSDSGAHVSQLLDSSIPTHLLGFWTREQQAFTLEAAVQKLTLAPAVAWGFHDRGMVREGFAADLCSTRTRSVPTCPQSLTTCPAGRLDGCCAARPAVMESGSRRRIASSTGWIGPGSNRQLRLAAPSSSRAQMAETGQHAFEGGPRPAEPLGLNDRVPHALELLLGGGVLPT